MELEVGKIHNGDCVVGMNALPEGCVDLVFADPPFNIGYKYDVYEDRMATADYLKWSQDWMQAVHRVLKKDGTFWLAIGDDFAAELKLEAQKIGFFCRSWVIWYYTFGVNCKHKFSRSHTHLFHFVKDLKKFTFRSEELVNRVPSARMLVYNDTRQNANGRLPDDTWIIPPEVPQTFSLRPQDLQECFQPQESDWYFPRVAGTFKERAGFHGCQMPEQLLGRIVRTCSAEGEVVMDPFSGSASTLVVAKKLRRKYLGFELSQEYVNAGKARLSDVSAGQALTGAPEPTMSAPQTWKDSVRKNKKTATGGDSALKLKQQIASAIDQGLQHACASSGAAGAQELLANKKYRKAFLADCRQMEIPLSDEQCLQRLQQLHPAPVTAVPVVTAPIVAAPGAAAPSLPFVD